MRVTALLPTRVLATLCLLVPWSKAGAARPGEKLWEFETGRAVWTSPAIGDGGTVYVASGVGKVHALDGRSGRELWSAAPGSFGLSSPAIGPDGTVYVGAGNGRLLAFNGADGQRLWEFEIGGTPYNSCPAIGTDGTVYVASDPGTVRALEGATGAEIWDFHPSDPGLAIPAVGADGTVYVGYDWKVYALDAATGQELWCYGSFPNTIQLPPQPSSSAIGTDGTVYIKLPGIATHALDGSTGQERWTSTKALNLEVCSPAVGVDGTVYVASFGRLFALDGTSGAQRWVSDPKTEFVSSPAIAADGTIYLGSWDHHLYALDEATGTVLWKFATGGPVHSSPTIGQDGTVYVGSNDKKVYAIQGTVGLAPSSWPKFQGDRRNSGCVNRPVRVGGQTSVVVLPEDHEGRLECWVEGWPLPDLQWSLNGIAIPNATTATLALPGVTRDAEGVYRLTASNGTGEAQSEITVVVSNVETEHFPAWRWDADGSPLVLEQSPSPFGPWSDLETFGAGETTGSHVETNPAESARFYRLRGDASARFTVSGMVPAWAYDAPSGTRHLIQYVDADHGWNNWQTLTTLTLPTSPYVFVDEASLENPSRVYRTTPIE